MLDLPDMGLEDDWQLDIDFDLADFDMSDGEDGLKTERYQKPRLYGGIKRKVMYEHALEFAQDIEFCRGMFCFAFVSGNFIFGDFLEALVESGKIDPKAMMVQTLSLSQDNIDSLRNIQEMCDLERLDIVLSAYFYSHERGKANGLVPYLYEQLDDGKLQVAFASIHSKLVTIETQAGNKIVMHGSANLRSSRNLEHICIQQDDDLYDFVESVGRRIMGAYGTIDKAKTLRGGKLWQAVRAEEKAGPRGGARRAPRNGA